ELAHYYLTPGGLRFSHLRRLRQINLRLLLDQVGGDLLTFDEGGTRGSNLEGEILYESLKFLIARDEVGFTVHFHEHPDAIAGMNIGRDGSLVCFSPGLLLCCSQPLLPQIVNGLVNVVCALLQRFLAIENTGAGLLAKLF